MGREKFKLVLWLLLLPLTIMGQKIEVVRFSLENSENMYSNVRKVFENLYSEQSNYLLIKTIYDGVTK